MRRATYLVAALAFYATPFAASAAGILPACVNNPTYGALSCQFCDIAELVNNLINVVIGLSIPVATLLFAYAGGKMATAGMRGSPGDLKEGKEILGTVGIGFIFILSGWLVVNTILHVLTQNNNSIQNSGRSFFYVGSCSQIGTGQGQRVISTQLPSILSSAFTPSASAPGISSESSGAPTNLASMQGTATTGACAQAASAFGSNACNMSYVCAAESGGVTNRGSLVDTTNDGQSFSVGLFQINLTQNNPAGNLNFPECTQAARVVDPTISGNLNCSEAFSDTNKNAYISDPALYEVCSAAASNIQCNTAAANYLLTQTNGGLNNWSAWKNRSTSPTCS